MLLSEGQMSDYKGAALMIDAFPKAKVLLGDKGYDADWFRAALAGPQDHGLQPVKGAWPPACGAATNRKRCASSTNGTSRSIGCGAGSRRSSGHGSTATDVTP
jgi:hypothetical protein